MKSPSNSNDSQAYPLRGKGTEPTEDEASTTLLVRYTNFIFVRIEYTEDEASTTLLVLYTNFIFVRTEYTEDEASTPLLVRYTNFIFVREAPNQHIGS